MTLRINFTVLDSNLYLRLMEEGMIVLSHHCILLIRVMTFIDEDLYYTICIILSTLYTEEDPHQGLKRLYL